MTDNEKRAHDLAVASAIVTARGLMDAAAASGRNETVDIYSLYMRAYSAALECFNRDFPSAK